MCLSPANVRAGFHLRISADSDLRGKVSVADHLFYATYIGYLQTRI